MDLGGSNHATKLLGELDQRQEEVLAGLDELNSRIERVLELYLEKRQASICSATEGDSRIA